MRERLYRTEAVILRRSDVGEADRILTIYTPTLGKRRVIAKGIRKTTSKLAGHLELFAYTSLMLATGRTFDVVTQSQIVQGYPVLRSDLQRLSAAYYVVELIDRLTEEEDANRSLFILLTQTLFALDSSSNLDLVLRFYEIHLLAYLGYRPHLYHCAACQDPLTEEAAHFSPSAGGVLCPRCGSTDRTALAMSLACFKLLRFLQRQPIEDIVQLRLSATVRDHTEVLLRSYLRRILERDLKSVVFLDTIRKQLGVQGDLDGLR